MTGNELLRLLKRLAKRRGVACWYDPGQGKGSHGRLYFGNGFTTLPDPRKEMRQGTLQGILRDLGITTDDLRNR
jgi:mRNA interferase HicA